PPPPAFFYMIRQPPIYKNRMVVGRVYFLLRDGFIFCWKILGRVLQQKKYLIRATKTVIKKGASGPFFLCGWGAAHYRTYG
ncbi:hypothetical protein ACVGW8_02480, partial [Enterobacter hormaechei]